MKAKNDFQAQRDVLKSLGEGGPGSTRWGGHTAASAGTVTRTKEQIAKRAKDKRVITPDAMYFPGGETGTSKLRRGLLPISPQGARVKDALDQRKISNKYYKIYQDPTTHVQAVKTMDSRVRKAAAVDARRVPPSMKRKMVQGARAAEKKAASLRLKRRRWADEQDRDTGEGRAIFRS